MSAVQPSREVRQRKVNPTPFRNCYNVGHTIGEGGFGTVRLVKSKETGKKLAVKIIEKASIEPGDMSLEIELDILCKVEHKNLVHCEEWFNGSEHVYIIMELLEGGALFDQLVKRGNYTESHAKSIFAQLSMGLYYLHENGVAHRDLKPENFLLTTDNPPVVKIADYGLSRLFRSKESDWMQTVCGSPHYISPEILEVYEGYSKGYSGIMADCWSVGACLYALLAGYPPFWKYDGKEAVLFSHIRQADWTFRESVWKSISAPAKDIVSKLLVKDVNKRIDMATVLAHPWVASSAQTTPLPETLKAMHVYQAITKFRRATLVAIAQRRFATAINSTKPRLQPATPGSGQKIETTW
mmetsp:Transcript_14929/g.48930  ORF Transcript_14929/g.48930 Transcript_14929/m.48930 type:complete len:354 (+) Transcript_14929:1037-2098(+)